MSKAIMCIAKNESQAASIVNQLKAAGFSSEDVSVLFSDKVGTTDFAHEHHTKAPEGAATGAGAGGLVGGTLGLLAGVGTLAVPGLGPFIAAGPIMAALSGAAVGAAVGGVTGALVGMGIPEFEAKRYESRLNQGNILISVHTENDKDRNIANAIFEHCDAEDVAATKEVGVKDKDRHLSKERDLGGKDYRYVDR